MKYYSVPADFKKETIDRYQALNNAYEDNKVIETYGNITVGSVFESGRSADMLPPVDFSLLSEFVSYSKEKNINFNYTINASHMQNKEFTREGILQLMSFLTKLYHAGVHSLTVSLPSVMEIVRRMKYHFEIKASVICQVTNPFRALSFKKLGVERLVADESIIRDFKALKKIRAAFGDQLEVIVNSICHKNCIYRMFHYNQIAADSVKVPDRASSNYYNHRCILRRCEDAVNLLKLSLIRPEDIKYYSAIGIRYFKIQGRNHVLKGDAVKALEYYFNESYDGDLLDLLNLFNPTGSFKINIDNRCLDGFIEPYYREEIVCDSDCDNCNYCDSFARKCINLKEAGEVYRRADEFYSGYDQFNQLLDSITAENPANPAKPAEPAAGTANKIDADFQLD
jgi:collagenase-like PrtC family protease